MLRFVRSRVRNHRSTTVDKDSAATPLRHVAGKEWATFAGVVQTSLVTIRPLAPGGIDAAMKLVYGYAGKWNQIR
jgi:hypothetical protein